MAEEVSLINTEKSILFNSRGSPSESQLKRLICEPSVVSSSPNAVAAAAFVVPAADFRSAPLASIGLISDRFGALAVSLFLSLSVSVLFSTDIWFFDD